MTYEFSEMEFVCAKGMEHIEKIQASYSKRLRARIAGKLFDHLEAHRLLIKKHKALWGTVQDKLFDLTVNHEWGEGHLYWDAFEIDQKYLVNVIRGLQDQVKSSAEVGCVGRCVGRCVGHGGQVVATGDGAANDGAAQIPTPD